MESCTKVIVVGSGPAGILLALHCKKNGFDVEVISPKPTARWEANYCFWADELEEKEFLSFVQQRWGSATVMTDGCDRLTIQREYSLFDTKRLQQHLVQSCQDVGIVFTTDRIRTTKREGTKTIVQGEQHTYQADIVVDATGNASSLLSFEQGRPPAYQLAYGQHLHLSHPYQGSLDEVTLMDFRTIDEESYPPSFLYVLPISETHVFVEETVLTTRESVSFPWLQERLLKKCHALGLAGTVQEEEFCRIKMGGALPALEQPLLGFGSAAGLVHPATGYQMVRTMNLAPKVALVSPNTNMIRWPSERLGRLFGQWHRDECGICISLEWMCFVN